MDMKSKPTLLSYLANTVKEGKSIPSIAQLGIDLGLSNASVREQLEVARQLELVEVKTKTGIQVTPFSVKPAICLASRYALDINPDLIWEMYSVRQQLELSYWQKAVVKLGREEVEQLGHIIDSAFHKIHNRPIIIPVEEHRDFHLTIYRPLNNTFLQSLLESFWTLFQDSENRLYSDQISLETVWDYHKKIFKAIDSKEYEMGYDALLTHFDIVRTSKKAELKQRFE
jgi:DNA-binding FadR family transcriptional regulator